MVYVRIRWPKFKEVNASPLPKATYVKLHINTVTRSSTINTKDFEILTGKRKELKRWQRRNVYSYVCLTNLAGFVY